MASLSTEDPLEDNEVFQIDDFTVITPLEMLISQLEMIIHDWELGKGSRNNNFEYKKDMEFCIVWESRNEKVELDEHHALNLTHYWPKNISRCKLEGKDDSECVYHEDARSYLTDSLKLVSNRELDFMPGSILTSQFGVLEFLLLTPFIWSNDMITDEDQLNFIMSAVNVALSNAECEIPTFVQYGTFDRHQYSGVSQNDSVRTEFLTSSIARQLTRHSNVHGLKEVFLDRMKTPYKQKIDATVSIMIDYALKEEIDFKQRFSSQGDFDTECAPELIWSTSYLPFGATSDLVENMSIVAAWMDRDLKWISEDNETEWYPFDAPDVYAYVDFYSGVLCALHQTLKGLLDISDSADGHERISSLLKKAGFDEANLGRNALASLASTHTISITNPTGVEASEGMDQGSIFRLVDAVFAKTAVGSKKVLHSNDISTTNVLIAPGGAVKRNESTLEHFSRIGAAEEQDETLVRKCQSLLEDSKSSPLASLTARMAIALTQVLKEHESGTVAFAQLWNAIVKELRDNWERNLFLPGIDSPYTPDHGTCRLHQKLQMLQCCIDSRRRRHQRFEESIFADQGNEEFFDAKEWLSEASEDEDVSDANDEKSSRFLSQGRSRQLDIFLLANPETPVYEPFLQERCPMTEDMVEKYTEYLSSFESPETRAKAQLEPLRSDMQAFKAANPGCIFEDFIRWHSPRDFVSDDTGEEGLSNRMKGENNVWIETWSDAEPRPIKYQKRLFNESKEAESILQEFMSLTVADLVAFIIPVVFRCAAEQLLKELSQVSLVNEKTVDLFKKILNCTHNGDRESYLDALRELCVIESTVSQYNALWSMFSQVGKGELEDKEKALALRKFTQSLLDASLSSSKFGVMGGGDNRIRCMVQCQHNHELSFPGKIMQHLFCTDDRLRLDEEIRKQYIFRCETSLPSIGSRLSPQRMYFSLVRGGPFRMGAAVSEDIVLQ